MKGQDLRLHSIAARCALAVIAGILAIADGCGWIPGGQDPPAPYSPMVEWPESAPIDLEAEIASSARLDGEEEAGAGAWPADERAAPGLLPDDTPGVFAREDEIEGLQYLEVVIGDARPRDRLPMVVFLHGLGDRPRIPGGPFLGLPVPVRVIAFRGPIPHGKGWSWFPVRVAEGKTDELAASIADVAERLALAIDGLVAAQETSGRPIVCGFSQGGILSYALAVLHPESVGTAFPLSGWLPPDLIPARPREAESVPLVWAMHGADDEVVPYGPTREMIERLWTIGLWVRLVEFEGTRHRMTGEMDALFHEWMRAAVLAQSGGTPMPTLMTGSGTAILPPLADVAASTDVGPDAIDQDPDASPGASAPGDAYSGTETGADVPDDRDRDQDTTPGADAPGGDDALALPSDAPSGASDGEDP